MKKLFMILCMAFLLTSCGTEYDINGTYELESGDKGFTVVICGDFCMMEVTSVNEDGGEATVILDGRVSREDEFVIITIDKDKQIAGNMFRFEAGEDILVNTSDASVLKKINPADDIPWGRYVAETENRSFELNINEEECSLTVRSVNEVGQTAEVTASGVLTADENIVSVEFESKTLGEDIYRFVYNSSSDILMDTTDGMIYEKITEENE